MHLFHHIAFAKNVSGLVSISITSYYIHEDIDDIIEGTGIHNSSLLPPPHANFSVHQNVEDSNYQQEDQMQCSSPKWAKVREEV